MRARVRQGERPGDRLSQQDGTGGRTEKAVTRPARFPLLEALRPGYEPDISSVVVGIQITEGVVKSCRHRDITTIRTLETSRIVSDHDDERSPLSRVMKVDGGNFV